MDSDERQADPPPAPPSAPEGLPAHYDADYDAAGRPSFDYVRDRIEGRLATSVGATELAGETSQAKSLQEQLDEREKAAKEKLDKIRESLHHDGGKGDAS
ncbi:MAG: Diaminopimelate decarboxylase [Pseudonocardia sp.]|nr:Diaminopimelate decarboxylase [Pseudonocardia sp.]